MTVYVLVDIVPGEVENVRVFTSKEDALAVARDEFHEFGYNPHCDSFVHEVTEGSPESESVWDAYSYAEQQGKG